MGKFMSSRTPAASRYAQEDYQQPGGGDVDESAVLANQAEQAMEDVIDGSEELVALGNDGDELVETYGEILPEVQALVDQSQEAGGLAVESVAFLAILGDKLGVEMPTQVATESYTGGRSNQARRMAMEAVTAHLGNWWQALKRWLTKMWKKLKDWWNKTFSGAASVKAAAEALKKRAQGMTSKTVKNENVTFGGVEYLINKSAKVSSGDILAGIKNIDSSIETLLGDHVRRITDSAKTVVEKMADLAFDKEDGASGGFNLASNQSHVAITEAMKAVKENVNKTAASLGITHTPPTSGALGVNPVFSKNLPTGATAKVSPEFLGNRVLYIIEGPEGIRFDFDAAGNKTSEAELEPKALSISEVTNVAGVIADVCNTIVRANASINSNDKVKRDLESAGDKVERVLASTDKSGDGATKLSSAFQRNARAIASLLDEPQHKFTAYALNVCNAAIRYGNASLATAS